MRVLVLPRYGPQGASSRLRFFQFLPALREAGIDTVVSPLFHDNLLLRKYQRGAYGIARLAGAYLQRIRYLLTRHHFDLVWIEKEALPWLPAWFEKRLLAQVPYVIDFDDAIFHNYDRNESAIIRTLFGRRIDKIMACSRLVVAGNSYLAARALQNAEYVEVLPTVVDLERYAPKHEVSARRPHLVWIGSPSTTQYLSMLAAPLAKLAQVRDFTLRIVGGKNPHMPGVDVEIREWSESTESQLIRECDIGVMPLADTPWEYGKCAYKLIQYMACGLPTVASSVGANNDVTVDGQTGYLASTQDEWIARLDVLLSSAVLRQKMGCAGRTRVEQYYSLQRIVPELVMLMRRIGTA